MSAEAHGISPGEKVIGSRSTLPLDVWLGPLRRRAAFARSGRAAIVGTAALASSSVLCAFVLGPLPHAALLGVGWTFVVGALVVAAWRPLTDLFALRGIGVASLLATADPSLAAATRSAWELARATPAGASRSLVLAHESRVRERLGVVRPAALVRIAHELGRGAAIAALALVIAIVIGLGSGRARAGLFALTHPLATSRTDAPTASVVESFDVRIVYPDYLRRDPLRVPSATRVDAPIGSTLELHVVPRITARRVEIVIGERRLGATRDGAAFQASFLVGEDAALGVTVTDDQGRVVRDSERRAVHAVPDAAPVVHMLSPEADRTIDPGDVLLLSYSATDDVGVLDAELVITPPDGRERRRRLRSESPSVESLFGDTTLEARELGIEPGDHVAVRIEARDANDVDGPGVGRSETRILTLASESTRRQDDIAQVEASRDAALLALADRLEVDVPGDEAAALSRFANGSAQITSLLGTLGRLSFAARRGETPRTDAPVYAGMVSRLRRVLAAERRLLEPRVGTLEARTTADRAVQDELENDVLTLTDMLARERVEDAAAIARELEQLRREIASLLRELARAPSDEARAALLTAIGRAEQRLTELRARLGAMGTSAPQEFGNVTEGDTRETQAALDAMREALLSGDLEAAARALTSLEQQIDGIARALGQGESSFAEAHFGERDRALAEAMDALQGLEAEERDLAAASSSARTEAAHAALETLGDEGAGRAAGLAQQARSVADALDAIATRHLGQTEREQRARTRQRLEDVADALASGDLGEARQMAEEADTEAEALARDLDLEAIMFPGHDGATADAARAAQGAARQARDLRSAIDRAIPDLRRHLSEPSRRSLQAGAPRQTAAAQAAERLADRFEHGPDGEPLVPDVGGDVRAIRDLMNEARTAREHEEPAETADAEGEAARRLSDLRQRLEQDSQHRRGDSSSGGASQELGRPVDIPEDHEGPMELRRRLLDAMSEDAPQGYDDAVRRYYEGLLR